LQEEYKLRKEKEKKHEMKEKWKIYDIKSKAIFGRNHGTEPLRYKDVPWPFVKDCIAADVTDFLLSGFDPGSSAYKDYLRQQQIQWHPDRFLQKCRTRLVEKDKEKIMKTVNEVSQILNALSEKS
jgi:NF-kappa-B inhibitor-like protein 1